MKRLMFILLLIVLLPTTACTGPLSAKSISGKVIDADTGHPIEGAILLVEWTKTRGFGNTYTTSEKVVELFSDKSGTVQIPGYDVRFVNEPDVTVYKPGYVAWNSNSIFLDSKHRVKRTDFEWKEGYVFKMDKFKVGYSYVEHGSFIDSCILRNLTRNSKNQIIKIVDDNERLFRIEERKVSDERK